MNNNELIERALKQEFVVSLVDTYVLNFVGSGDKAKEERGTEVRDALLAYARSAMEFVLAIDTPAPAQERGDWWQSWLNETATLHFAAGIREHYLSAAKEFVATRDWLHCKDMAAYMFARICSDTTTVVTLMRFDLDPELLRI